MIKETHKTIYRDRLACEVYQRYKPLPQNLERLPKYNKQNKPRGLT